MLETPCSGLVWRTLATHSIRHVPLHFPSRASPWSITFQKESTIFRMNALPPFSRSMRGKCDCFTFPVHCSHWPVQGSSYFHTPPPRQSFLQSGSPTCLPYAFPSCKWEQEFFPNPYFGSRWNESHWSWLCWHVVNWTLYSWVRASWIKFNNCSKRCDCIQFITFL